MVMAVCKLWVQDSRSTTTVRADQIITVRAVPGQHAVLRTAEPARNFRCRLDIVVDESRGENGTRIVPLCHGNNEDFEDDAAGGLLRMIAAHVDDPHGGIIDSCDEDIAAAQAEGMFSFLPFAQHRGPQAVT